MGFSKRAAAFIVAFVAGSLVAIPALAGLDDSKKTVNLVYGKRGTATANCEKGTHVAFGGFKTEHKSQFQQDYLVFADAMGPKDDDADSWASTAHPTTAIYDTKVTSYAYCEKGAKPAVARATKTAQPSERPTTVIAHCPAGKTLIGGGFSSNADPEMNQRIIPVTLDRAGDNQAWEVGIINDRTTAVKITAIAVCGKGKRAKPVEQKVDLKQYSPPKSATAKCPKGKSVAFSGMRAEYNSVKFIAALPTGLYRSKINAVTAVGVFGGGTSINTKAALTAIAYCN